MPDLSRNDINMVLEVFKSRWTGCETSEWYRAFKGSFEQMHEQKKQAQRQAEENRANQARLRGEARRARLKAELEEAKQEGYEGRPVLQEILTPLTHWPGEPASSSVGPPGASTAEPASSGGDTETARPQTPQRSPRCKICERNTHEHSICVFCELDNSILSNDSLCLQGPWVGSVETIVLLFGSIKSFRGHSHPAMTLATVA